MTLTIISTFALVLLSAFFSASETAITTASRPLMYQLEQSGNRRAAVVNRLRGQIDRVLNAILLGNNLVNILASALATSALIVLFGDAGVAYATVGMTFLVLIFGEVLPKTYAFRRANTVALRVAPLLVILIRVLTPVILVVNTVVQTVLRLAGVRVRSTLGARSAELRGAIALYAAGDKEARQEKAMLHSILDLQEVEIGEIMTHRSLVTMINADDAPAAIVAQVLASPFSRFPVWRAEPDNVIGVIHAKALLRAAHGPEGELRGCSVAELAAPPWFVPETTTLFDQLEAFRRRHEHFALVVDEYGALMGIVTLEDILEEIVGEIDDEHDLPMTGVSREAGGRLVIRGTVTLRDLNREFGWRLPDAEAVTLAGLLLHEARRIPEVGDTFDLHGLHCEVLRRHRHQITAVRVTPVPGQVDPLRPPR
ncbi:MAG: HlyC/CorC family transporter [Rhodospirillales bacterium]